MVCGGTTAGCILQVPRRVFVGNTNISTTRSTLLTRTINRLRAALRCKKFLCTSERQRCALILIFADSLPMLCSLRLWQTPGFRYHRRYRLGRVDVSVNCAMFGFRLYMLCVILRSSTWAPDCGVLFPRPLVFVVNWSCCSPVFAVLASSCHFARKGSTGHCVTLILWHTSLSRDSPA